MVAQTNSKEHVFEDFYKAYEHTINRGFSIIYLLEDHKTRLVPVV